MQCKHVDHEFRDARESSDGPSTGELTSVLGRNVKEMDSDVHKLAEPQRARIVQRDGRRGPEHALYEQ